MEETKIYRDPRLLSQRGVDLRTGGKTCLNSDRLGNPNSLDSGSESATLCSSALNSAEEALLSANHNALCIENKIKKKIGDSKIWNP